LFKIIELKTLGPKDLGLLNINTESTENATNQPINAEEIKKETNVEVKNEQVKVKQENDVKTETVIDQKVVKIENEDEQNVKIDVTSSPGYVHIKNKIIVID